MSVPQLGSDTVLNDNNSRSIAVFDFSDLMNKIWRRDVPQQGKPLA